jgi:hypothetical protein|tara:strand:- start:1064 stop:1306 length:243 start_codon:yes stop_codon:yes gene_type:complete
MQPNARQAVKKMIWHYENELLFATSSVDKEKYAEKIIEWSERLENTPSRKEIWCPVCGEYEAEEKTIRAIQENIIEPMIK